MNSNSNITTSGQLKFTQSEIDYLSQFLKANDRGGYYLALYNMTGVTQVLVQGEISTFSESGGGAAYVSNMLMYKCKDDYKIKLKAYLDNPENGYLGKPVTLDTFSNIIAKTDLDNMDLYRKDENEDDKYPLKNDSTGYFDNGLMLEKAFEAWKNVDLFDYFPGQSLATAEHAVLYVQDVIEKINQQYEGAIPSKLEALKTAIQVYVNEFQNQAFDSKKFLDALWTTGTGFAVLGVLLGSRFVAKKLSDFEDREGYKIVDLPDAKYKVVIDINTGFVAGMFRDEFVPDTLPSVLTTVAEYWPELVGFISGLLTGGPSGGLSGLSSATIFAEILENVGKLYKESFMFQPGEYSGMPTKWAELLSKHSETGTENNETLWGTGGENNAAIADIIHSGGGDDRIFSGDGADQIHGDAGDDILYGQKGADYLYGGDDKDTLRGGEGNDHLYGGNSDDYLDGGDITDAESGDDFLIGGKGKDVLVGASGSDFLYGDNENAVSEQDDGDDELYGGDGIDYLTGGGGNDYLDGGEGEDHYYFNGNYGYDVIKDQDGKGKIIINGSLLKVGEKQNNVLWLSEDQKYYINLQPDFNGITESKKLVITAVNGNEENSISVKNWRNGDLGITLDGNLDPQPTNQIVTGEGTNGDDYIIDSVYVSRSGGSYRDIRGDADYLYNDQTDLYRINARQGNDSIILDGKNYEIYLGKGEINKVITGNGHIFVYGDQASDQIFTGSGNDTLYLESLISFNAISSLESSTVSYGNGETTLKLNANWWNFAYTDLGEDTIYGGYSKDIVYSGGNDDLVVGGGGNDEIYGENGNDILYGDNHVELNFDLLNNRFLIDERSPNINKLDMERLLNPYMLEHYVGGSLTATNFGYHGNDRVYGGSGNDIIFGHGGSDFLYGGNDNDVISGDSTYVALIEYTGITLGNNARHIVTEEEYSQVNNTIAKNRYIFSGSDKIYGESGDDIILGGLKDDLLDGGDGNDIIYGDSDVVNEQIIKGGSIGVEIPRIQWQFIKLDDERFTKIYPHFEEANGEKLWNANDKIYGGNGNDRIHAEEGNDLVYGGGNNDVIYGDQTEFGVDQRFHGNDELYGDDGEDTIFGDGGDDRLFGGNDKDYLYGDGWRQEGQWHGNDTIFGGNGDDEILGQGGKDEIHGDEGTDYINGDDDNLEGQYHGEDILFGGNGKDYIIGNGKRDMLYGGIDHDILYGDSETLDKIWHGNDELYGGEGNDKLYGGGGNDLLDGGIGNDQLSGDEGNDQYQFSKGHGQDIIFEKEGLDKIVLNDIKYKEAVFLKLLNNLIITGYSGNDSVSVTDYFLDENHKIESIKFEDQTVDLENIEHSIIEFPIDPIINLPYNVIIKNDENNEFNIYQSEKLLAISKGDFGSFLVSQSDDVTLLGSKSNYFSISNTDHIKVFGGNDLDHYNVSYSSDVKIYDDNFTGIININTAATYFKWIYDFSCDGWILSKSPMDMNLIEHQQNSSGTITIDSYKLNENSLRLNEIIYDARSGEFMIQNNHAYYTGANSPGAAYIKPEAGVTPQEIKSYSNLYIQNVFNSTQLDLLLSNMKVNLASYGYSLVGGHSVNVLNSTINLKEYINQGNVTSYYTDQDEIIHGLRNYTGNKTTSDQRLETIYAGAGNDQVYTGSGNSHVYAEEGNDLIIARDTWAIDEIYGGGGDDIIYNYDPTDIVQTNTYYSSDRVYGGAGNDTIYIKYQAAQAYGGEGNDIIIGDGELYGDAGNDTLVAGEEGSYMDGGEGADILRGGVGNDTYVIDEFDTIDLSNENGGYDTLIYTYDVHQVDLANSQIEAVELSGFYNSTLYGNAENNRLIGNDGNNYINGRTGSDYMAGGLGDDYYVVDRIDTVATDEDGNTYIVEGDQIIEDSDGGMDTIERWQDARFISQDTNGNPVLSNNHRLLEDNIENLILKGSAKTAFGNNLNNIIVGNEQDNYIDGLGGNDTYVFAKGGATDTYSFYDDIAATNILKIQGYSTNDVFAQKYGNSVYLSFKGTNDHIWLSNYYIADTANKTYKMDQIIFDSGTVWTSSDIDTLVNRAASNHAPTVNVAIPTISSNQGAGFSYKFASNVIIDQDSWDSLTYKITLTTKDSSGQYQPIPSWLIFDPVTQTLSGTPPSSVTGNLTFFYWGTDMYGLGTGTSFTLKVNPPNQAPIVLNAIADQSFTDAKAFSYTIPSTAFKDPDGDTLTYTATLEDGSPLPSWLSFNTSTRVLSGTSLDYTAPLNIKITAKDTANQAVSDVFKLTFVVQNQTINGTSSADTLYGASGNDTITGQAGNDILYGQSGNDTLNGGTGNDTMYGGKGDDIYIVDSTSDIVIENIDEGTDTVQSSVTYSLGNNVENLTLTGTTAINGTGNALNNILIGNSAINTLTGGAGDDYLDGGAGADKLFGGIGNDTYVIDNTGDTITENSNEGIDTVLSSITYTLGNHLDNLTLTGTTAINGTGNTLNNILIGNSAVNTLTGGAGDDYLDGGAGADKLLGGIGNDTYVIDNTGDVITENANEGIDTVLSSISYTLGNNLENLTLTGTSAINATGNTLNNILIGNSGTNVLNGGAGNDILDGQGGNDQYIGGTGSDTLIYNLLVASDALGGNGSDSWSDFTVGNTTTNANADKIDISDLLVDYHGSYSSSSLDPFIKTVISGSNTQLYIDRDGAGSTYNSSLLLTLNNVNTNLNDLINNQQIII